MLERIEEPSDIVQVYSQLSQYPILAPEIRERMREELFRRGIVRPDRLEEEVKDRAVISQKREGLNNPMFEEDEGIWLQRLRFIRDYLTDFYFAHNLPIELTSFVGRESEVSRARELLETTRLLTLFFLFDLANFFLSFKAFLPRLSGTGFFSKLWSSPLINNITILVMFIT